MTNKEIFIETINNLGYELGCYTEKIDKVPKKFQLLLLQALEEEYIDVPVTIRGKEYMIEICTVDKEKDMILLTKEEYINRYGETI